MKQMISTNDDSQEVHTKFMLYDLERWSAELKMVDLELSFYGDFLNFATFEDLNPEVKGKFVGKIVELKSVNATVAQEFQEFSNKVQGIIECDDLQCETYYVNNHTDFKQSIENHFSEFRLFKTSFLDYLQQHLIQ